MFVLLGFALMRTLVPGGRRFCRHDFWRALLGSGLGVGIGSLTFLASLVTRIPELAMEAVLLIVLAWLAWRSAECSFCKTAVRPWDLLDRCIALAFALALTCGAASFLRQTNTTPRGQWDAWAIHNLHARFLYHSAAWRDLFTPVLTWSHPDYPLLVPGFVASWWTFLGNDRAVVPAATAFLFTFGTGALLASSIALLRDRRQGLLAGLVMLGAPTFVSIGAWQVADVPLAWFLLAATVLLAMDYPAAAGLAAGFAAWTKNDGVMLFAAVVLGWSLTRQWTFQRLRNFGLGALVPLAVLVWFKLTLAPPNPLVSSVNARQHLMDASRHFTIIEAFVRHLWTFGGLFASPFLFLAAYAALMPFEKAHWGAVRAVGLTLVLAACGDWGVYLFATHMPLVDLIDSSLARLLVQIWPIAVFLVFLAADVVERTPESVGGAREGLSARFPQVLASKSLLFSIVLICITLVSCGQNASPTESTPRLPPARGVTQNLVARQTGVLYHIDLVGPVINPEGRTVSAFATRVLSVTGWAVDTDSKRVASNVDVVVDGVPYAARYGAPRKDVAAYFKNGTYEKSGFEFSIPAGGLAKGSHTFFIRVVGRDGNWFVQSNQIIVVLG